MQMNISSQIRKLRDEKNISQEELAEKVFVSRQTISNWENDKNYPDIKSLLLMCEVFDVSLDYLVKGDVETMKKAIQNDDIKKMRLYSNIYAIEWVGFLLLAIILVNMLMNKTPFTSRNYIFIGICVIFYVIMMTTAFKLEKIKKANDVQTYKEIIAFLEGKKIDESDKKEELVKRPYQKILMGVSAGLITALFLIIFIVLKKIF